MPLTKVLLYEDADGTVPVQSWLNYRILYFFHGKDLAVLAHGLTKRGNVPGVDIARAIRRKEAFQKAPEMHAYEESDRGENQHD